MSDSPETGKEELDRIEAAVLSACFLGRDAIARIRGRIRLEHFDRSAHRRIAAELLTQYDAGESPDVLTVEHGLRQSGELEACGGMEYLGQVVDAVPSAANIETHHHRLIEAAHRRQLARVVDTARADLSASTVSTDDVRLALLESLMTSDDAQRPRGFRPVDAMAALERYERRAQGQVTGIRSGFAAFDAETAGLQPGELAVVGAIAKHGKTMFATQWGLQASLGYGHGVALVSAEMGYNAIHDRILSALAGVPLQQLMSGDIPPSAWPRLLAAQTRLDKKPTRWWIDDEALPQLRDVEARVLALKAQHPELALVIVDFLQLVQCRLKGRRGDEELDAISYGLKRIADRAEVAIVAPAQLNQKSVDARADRIPQLSDMSGGMGPVKGADLILLLHRPALATSGDDDSSARQGSPFNMATDRMLVTVQGARRTRPFTFSLDWQGTVARLVDPDHWTAPNEPMWLPAA